MIFGKRGQESMGGGTLIALLVLIVAAGLIAFFLYKFWVGGATPLVDAQDPSMLSAITGCKASIAAAGNAGYCNQFKKVTPAGGVTQYMTCQYIQETLKYSNFSSDSAIITCTDKATILSTQCSELNKAHTQSSDSTSWTEYVDGKKCTKTGIA